MSEKKRFEYKIQLEKIKGKNLERWERLIGKIGLIVGGLILLTAIVISIVGGR